jgi:hypothetical protein
VDRAEHLKQLKIDYNTLFSSENGKRVLKDLKKYVGTERIFNPKTPDGFIDVNRIVAHNAQCNVLLYIESFLRE